MTDLFSDIPGPPLRVLDVHGPAAARATDPQSSHAAADAVNQSGTAYSNAVAVARLVRIKPGATSLELLRKYLELAPIGRWPTLDRTEISRRLPDAERFGWVRRGEHRVCGVSGKRLLTWWPVGQAEQA